MCDSQVVIVPIKVEDTIPLRHSVLWPEREVSYVSLPEDNEGYHFGAFLPSQRRDTPICIISLFLAAIPRTEVDDSPSNAEHHTGAARFRKFACHPVYQRRGIGTKLLEHVFSVAFSELGVTVIWCDARVTSIDWYKKRGMTSSGGIFRKDGLEYIRMQKSIDQMTVLDIN
ncbi:hypothetical protein PILCRDRAFT_6998 [Piloderma croceum F 1598]|uniref:N-acetyltransferase domain-containing protein n=1 Tax=Piloderma croceum (strain F 1598) TaxID=765440 RepID=A0A0C3FZ32_PILCF|nr:hypothetical protein PILCRDRAFT_6998 [Piloderma croceum F 1598]